MLKFIYFVILITTVFADECRDYNSANNSNYNCDCNESTWESYYSYMLGCWLPNADFQNTDLKWANLEGAYLVGADLRNAQLLTANLTNAYLVNANLLELQYLLE